MNGFENYLKNLDIKQKAMIYLSIVFVVFIVLNQFVPQLINEQESIQSNIDITQMKILNNSTKKLKSDLVKINKLNLKNEDTLNETKDKINYLMSSLYKVKFAFFREVELAKTLDLLLQESLKKGIDLNYIKNVNENIENTSDLIQYKTSMLIDGIGGYKKVLHFLNYIENLNYLFTMNDIKILEIKESSDVHFSLQVNFYGVGL